MIGDRTFSPTMRLDQIDEKVLLIYILTIIANSNWHAVEQGVGPDLPWETVTAIQAAHEAYTEILNQYVVWPQLLALPS